jgi:hypothetical protein
MMNLDNYKQFIIKESNNEVFGPEFIVDYISSITPDVDGVPFYYLNKIESEGIRFVLKEMSIEEILNSDPNVLEYVEGNVDRYEDEEIDPKGIDLPIVILGNEVIDGYNRISTKYHNGEESIEAYVSI